MKTHMFCLAMDSRRSVIEGRDETEKEGERKTGKSYNVTRCNSQSKYSYVSPKLSNNGKKHALME